MEIPRPNSWTKEDLNESIEDIRMSVQLTVERMDALCSVYQ